MLLLFSVLLILATTVAGESKLSTANVIGLGYDVTGRLGLSEAKAAVIDHKWDEAVQVQRDGQTYLIPNTLFLQDIRESHLTFDEYNSLESMQEKLSASGGLSARLACFKGEADFRWFQFTNKVLTKSTSERSIAVYMYYLGLAATGSDFQLTGDFQQMVSSLPSRWEDDPSAFEALIAKYGTHVISGVRFGARLTNTVASEKSLQEERKEMDVTVRAGVDFGLFSIMVTVYEDHQSSGFRNFAETHRARLINQGGSTVGIDAVDPSAGLRWLDTITDALEPLDFVYRSIYDLISDRKKAQGLATAVAIHLWRSNLPTFQALGQGGVKLEGCRALEGVSVDRGQTTWRNAHTLKQRQCYLLFHSYSPLDTFQTIITPVPGNPSTFVTVEVSQERLSLLNANNEVLASQRIVGQYSPALYHLLQICLSDKNLLSATLYLKTDVNIAEISRVISTAAPVSSLQNAGPTVLVEQPLPTALTRSQVLYFGVRSRASNKDAVRVAFLQRCVVKDPKQSRLEIEEEQTVEDSENATEIKAFESGASSFIETEETKADLWKEEAQESEFLETESVTLFQGSVEDHFSQLELDQDKAATFLMPGYSLLGMGFDATKSPGVEGATGKILENSYQMKEVDVCGQKFQVPQHTDVTRLCESNARTAVFQSRGDYERYLSVQAGAEFRVGIFVGGIDMDMKSYQHDDARKVIGKHYNDVALCRMDLHDPPARKQSLGFSLDLEDLPERWEEDPIKYARFVKKWGTHYVRSVLLGGRMELTQISTFNDTSSKMNIEGQARVGLDLVVMSLSGSVGVSYANAKQSVLNISSTEARMFGGDAVLAAKIQATSPTATNKMGFDPAVAVLSWFKSATQHPSAYQYQIAALTELLPASSAKRRALDLAISLYMQRQNPDDIIVVLPNEEMWSPFFLYSEDSCISVKASVAETDSLRIMLAAVPGRQDRRYEIEVNSKHVSITARGQQVHENNDIENLALGVSSIFGDYVVCYQNGYLQYGRNGKISVSAKIPQSNGAYFFGFSGKSNKQKYFVTSMNLVPRQDLGL